MVVKPVKWTPNAMSTQCNVCLQKFGIMKRRHHCRKCGELVCHPCSSHRDFVPGYSDKKVRICVTCNNNNVQVKMQKLNDRKQLVMSALTIKNPPGYGLQHLK